MSSLKHPSPGSEESEAEKLYFSYGSNMHLQQMAARCHDSTLFAKGILRSYKWQINSRGGANVIDGDRADFVEGIVFTVSPSDVRALRHYEGVKQQFYAEKEFDIEVDHILDTALEGRKPADAARILALHKSESRLTESNSSADAAIPGQSHTNSNSTAEDTNLQMSRECPTTSHQSGPEPTFKFSHEKPSTSKAEEPGSLTRHRFKQLREYKLTTSKVLSTRMTKNQNGYLITIPQAKTRSQTQVRQSFSGSRQPGRVLITEEGEKAIRKALIYISYEHQLPGDIREEYIGRMQLAMADARMLGVSQNYLETSLHPLVFGKRTGARPDEVRSRLQRPAPRAPSLDTSLNDEQMTRAAS